MPKTKEPSPTLPVIHLNGSGLNHLTSLYEEAYQKVWDAVSALESINPHDRDYYVAGPEAGPKARAEHVERLKKIRGIQADLETIINHLRSHQT